MNTVTRRHDLDRYTEDLSHEAIFVSSSDVTTDGTVGHLTSPVDDDGKLKWQPQWDNGKAWLGALLPTGRSVNGVDVHLHVEGGAELRLHVEVLEKGDWLPIGQPVVSTASDGEDSEGSTEGSARTVSLQFPTYTTMGVRIVLDCFSGEDSGPAVLVDQFAVLGQGGPVPYLNSLGVEISHLAWNDMLRRGRHPIAEIFYMFDWINGYFRDQGVGYTQFHLPVVKRLPLEKDPEEPMSYFWADHDWDQYNCFIFVSQEVGGYAAPNKGPRIGCHYDANYEEKQWHYVPWAGLQRRAMAHELGHFRGVQDFYTAAVSPEKNHVNGEGYQPSMRALPALMVTHYPEDIVISDYTKHIFWHKREQTVPLSEHYIWKETPAKAWVEVVDETGRPVPDVTVNVYLVDFWKDPQVAGPPVRSGTTDQRGRFLFAQREGNNDLDLTFNLLLFETVQQESKTYAWLELLPLNFAYWKGELDEFVFQITLDGLPQGGDGGNDAQ